MSPNTSSPPVRAFLRVPLLWKIAGANLVIVVATAAAVVLAHRGGASEGAVIGVVLGALVAGLLVNLLLVHVALLPVRVLEVTARRVADGDLAARVERSPIADRDMERVGETLNLLLERLTSDRERARRLASEVIGAGDRERARIARDLHDSTAQSLAALLFQFTAAVRESTDPQLAGRLQEIKQIAVDVLEEVRTLAYTVHPRVLDDLGLVAALRNLARQAEGRSGSKVEVVADARANGVPHTTAAVLYRVAQEAVGNALRHGSPRNVTIRLNGDGHSSRLEILDDGVGLDLAEVERRHSGLGLFTMRERVSLVGGKFSIASRPGAGTRVEVTVPVTT